MFRVMFDDHDKSSEAKSRYANGELRRRRRRRRTFFVRPARTLAIMVATLVSSVPKGD